MRCMKICQTQQGGITLCETEKTFHKLPASVCITSSLVMMTAVDAGLSVFDQLCLDSRGLFSLYGCDNICFEWVCIATNNVSAQNCLMSVLLVAVTFTLIPSQSCSSGQVTPMSVKVQSCFLASIAAVWEKRPIIWLDWHVVTVLLHITVVAVLMQLSKRKR